MGRRKKPIERTCLNCHYFIRIDGKPACTNTDNGQVLYKFLKDTKLCDTTKHWLVKEAL